MTNVRKICKKNDHSIAMSEFALDMLNSNHREKY